MNRRKPGNRVVLIIFMCTAAALVSACKSPSLPTSEQDWVKTFQTSFENPGLDFENTWMLEGSGVAWVRDGKMHMREDSAGVGVVLWLRQYLPASHYLSFDVSFSNNRGIGVFFLSASETGGGGLLVPTHPRKGEYEEYIRGTMNNYSFSMHRYWPDGRNNPGANLRKNPGFSLLSQALPDPMPLANHTYHVEAVRTGEGITIRVDNEVVHSWTEDETNGEPHGSGHVGFRLRGDSSCIMSLDNIIIKVR